MQKDNSVAFATLFFCFLNHTVFTKKCTVSPKSIQVLQKSVQFLQKTIQVQQFNG